MRHSQPYPRLSFWLVLAGLAASTPALSQVQDLGSTFDRSAVARKISANGRVIIGSTLLVDSFTEQPFRFTDAGGFEILPPFNGGYGTPVGVSDDGTFIAGYVGNARAVRWTEAGPPLDLTPTAASSTATAISGDGSTVVGAVRQPGSSFHCLRWTEAGGPVDIHPSFAPAHFTSWAAAVSQDGSVVVGSVWDSSVGSNYLPRAFVWTAATGAVDIGLSANADISTGLAVSDDGSVIAGAGRFGTTQLQPFVWTAAGGMVALGEVGTDFFMDVGISGDGSTIFGECSPEGFRWTQASGLQIFPGFSAWFHPTSSTYDGETLAGFLSISGDSVGAVTWTAATGTTLLPVLTGLASIAWDLTPDGSIIAGELTGQTGRRATRWRDDQTIGAPYCDPAVANSASATGAFLSLGGSNRAAEGALILNVTDLPPNSFGFFLVSRVRDLVAMPGGSQGTLCLGSAIGRFVGPGQIMQSGPEGAFSLTVDPTTIPFPSGPVLPSFGETWHFQAWYRDANPGVTSNFSSAGSVPIY